MSLHSRGELPAPNLPLQLLAPRVEDVLGLRLEPDVGDGAVFWLVKRQAVHKLEDLDYLVSRLAVGGAVDVLPALGMVGPNEQLVALEQAVIAGRALSCVVHVAAQGPGLYTPEDGQAQGFDPQRTPPDPVHVKGLVAVPGLQVELAVPLPTVPVEAAQEAGEFVAEDH